MKINWKQKLTSRKFWTAIASFVALLIVATGGTQNQATQITAIIMAGATVVAYIVGEGLIDSASAGSSANTSANSSSGQVIGTVQPQATQQDNTGAANAAQTKQVTADLSTADKVTTQMAKA